MATKPPRPCRQRGCVALVRSASGFCAMHQQVQQARRRIYDDRRGSSAQRGYGYAWQQLRAEVIAQEPICRVCRIAPSAEVDHILPLKRGGSNDRANLQALCHACHVTKTQREAPRRTMHTHVRQERSMAPVTLVCGPPGSGKTTYVREHARPGDLIVDVDALWSAVSGLDWYDKPDALLPFVLAAREALIRRLAQANSIRHAWVITAGASSYDRDQYARRIGAHVVVLEVDADECLRRIATDARREARGSVWPGLVRDWWRDYQPRDGDERVIATAEANVA